MFLVPLRIMKHEEMRVKRGGFSLIEVLIVVSVLSILAAMATGR